MKDQRQTKKQLLEEIDLLRKQLNEALSKDGGFTQNKGDAFHNAPLLPILEAAPDPIIIYDLEGKVVFINQSFTRVFGWAATELLYKKLNFVPAADAPETAAAVQRMLKGEIIEHFETHRYAKDGRVLDIQGSSAIVQDLDGRTVGSVVILRDVTEHRRMEEALRESEERYRTVMEAVADPIVVYDMEGRVVYFNPAFTQVFGWSLAERVGRTFSDFVPPENWAETHFMIEKVRTGEKFHGVESQRYDREGQLIPVSISGANYFDPNGRLKGSVINLRNISKWKIAQAALEESEKRYRSVFENTGTATVIINHQMIIVMANNMFETLSGYTKQDIEHKMRWTDFVAPSDLERMKGYHADRKAGKDAPTEYEFKLINKSGGERDILLRVGVIPTAGQVVASLTDITKRKEMEQAVAAANLALRNSLDDLRRTQKRLVESEKMAALGGLVAGMAHEINNPLGACITAASFLDMEISKQKEEVESGGPDREGYEKFLNGIHQAAGILCTKLTQSAELVNSFKQVAVDQSSVDRRRFQVKAYAVEILRSLEPKLKSKPIRVELDCPDDLQVESYPWVLYQIVINLVTNSLQHAFEGRTSGLIRIQFQPGDACLLFRYQDNGCGMSSDQVKRIYDPFFTTKRGQGGIGLGMHIVYNLVSQKLKGTIECSSRPDEGMSCTITIPVPITTNAIVENPRLS